jgi:hypothetical protein
MQAKDIQEYEYKDYGSWFQLFAYAIERLLNLRASNDIFMLRHYLCFIVFSISIYCFHDILRKVLNSEIDALLGTVMLLASPRIFAESFYNVKDTVFMSFVIINGYSFCKFLERRSSKTLLVHALTTSLTIGVRVAGVYVVLLTCLLILVGPPYPDVSRKFKLVAIYLLSSFLLTVLFWPSLWNDSFVNFAESFKNMSRYRWYGDVFFMGQHIYSHDLPWYYIPVWVLATTPVSFVCLAIFGLFVVSHRYREHSTILKNMALWALLSILTPYCATLIFKSSLYNGWRHFYFIYPNIVLFSTVGLSKIVKHWTKRRTYVTFSILFLVVVEFVLTVRFIVYNHPFQNNYFNVFYQKNAWKSFELDYYGTSYKRALEYLLEDTHGEVKISVLSAAGEINKFNFAEVDIERLVYVPLSEAEYFVSNFYGSKVSTQRYLAGEFPYNQEEIFSVCVGENKIIAVFKINPNERMDLDW